jgi:hypothetical protein
LSGSSKLPLYFVREIFALSGRRQPAKPGNYTISDLCSDFMPVTCHRLSRKGLSGSWFDDCKWNKLPVVINNMDLALQPAIKTRSVPVSVLGFASSRRCLNESAHYEFVLRHYSDDGFSSSSASDLSKTSEALEKMWTEGIDEDRLRKAVVASKTTFGKHARTGYLTPPITVMAPDVPCNRAARLARYMVEVHGRLREFRTGTVFDAIFQLEDLLNLRSTSFQFYQIGMLLDRAQAASRVKNSKLGAFCAGPGMVPLCCAMTTDEKLRDKFFKPSACQSVAAPGGVHDHPVEEAESEGSEEDGGEEEPVVGKTAAQAKVSEKGSFGTR